MEETTVNKGEATRVRIVEAAYRLFLEQGYHGTSMRQIGDRAEITMGGIYNHFASKEAIWEEVLMAKHPYHEILPLLETAEGSTVDEFVRDAASRLVRELGRRTDVLNLMFIELVEFNGIHIPRLYEAILPHLLRLSEVFSHKRGHLRTLSLPVLARSFSGFFFSYYVTGLLMPPAARRAMGRDALEDFVDIYLYGILAGPTEHTHD
ncbi:MAG: TetR/AcrR family transcriptional regulator [Caldilineaceae bacterium]|nr:TetR/AcrR family transcriptional regulator [Caldilineaceae bacterium]